MIVHCPSCTARFQYDETRFQGVTSKRFKCPKCKTTFEVKNPTLESPVIDLPMSAELPGPTVPAPVPAPAPAPPDPAPGAGVRDTTARKDRQTLMAAINSACGMPAGWRISLAFLTGPQASMVKVLDKPVLTIGREEGDIITGDPETSRRHLSIEVHSDGSVWLTDLGSTNGTFVDGVQVFGTIQLMDRQEFTCGKCTFMILIRREDPQHLD